MKKISYKGANYTPFALLKSFFLADMGWGEEYVKGNITVDGGCDGLVEFIHKNRGAKRWLPYFRAFNNGSDVHYDLPAEFYEKLLGPVMSYTCGNYDGDASMELHIAQLKKHAVHDEWLDVSDSPSLLECGCGWGSFAEFCNNSDYTGLSISNSQLEYCRKKFKNKLKKWGFIFSSWQNFNFINYDRFTAIGMLEHVGKDNLHDFFPWVRSILTNNSVGTLQFISRDKTISPWADKYIFNGAYPPSFNEVSRLMRQNGLAVTDLVERGGDYVLTLRAWLENLEEHKEWIVEQFNIEFYRMFELYLCGGIDSFDSGDSQLIQLRFEVAG